ncbi:MAG: DNA polymerase III subunit alpha [Parcubacteria group bacterium]|nr:DNA polymerase III subunit alpha [Parcubacteria group bacterium]
MKFAHLHTHSHYSLLDGLAKIDELVARAKELGMSSLALTDHGALYGAIEFYKKAREGGIKPILGVETYIAPHGHENKRPKIDDKRYHLILLCENETGWKNLVRLITKAHLDGYYYKPRVDKELLRRHHEGLIALSGCVSGEIAKLLVADRYEEAKKAAREYEEIFREGNFFLEIGHHPNVPDSQKARESLIRLSRETSIPLVATQDIHYLKPEDAEYHDILLAVQTGNKVTDDDRLSLRGDDFSMTSPEQMAEFFRDVPEAVSNTSAIADRCNLELKLNETQLPSYPLPEGVFPDIHLRELALERLSQRYAPDDQKVLERFEYELGVIEKTGFAEYFLIVADLIKWAKDRGIVVGPGRGSAAGSLVSYVLGITDIDPLKYNLLFERFLNPDRIQMPDIDIDFADTRRDEVLAYVKQKYGESNVAQIITFGTMAARAAIRDAGRALGLSYGFCDKIAKLIPFNSGLSDAVSAVSELGDLYKNDPDAKKVIDAAKKLEGVARHASTHACGVVISKKPLIEHLPLQRSPQDENSVITQLEMHSVEDLGLLKMDFLGLKNLTIIEETVRLAKEFADARIDIAALPLDDKKTFELLQRGDTTGVFQLESSGMRRYLKEIRPTELEDIIAMVALYRPGPMELIPIYVNRKHGRERISYLHPKLEPILKNTYGIGVYQEQMMQIARDLAGFTLAEADTLRKAIGKKIKSLLDKQQEKLISGMIQNGIDKRTAAQIWELFPPFARYGFNRSHAACYALIGYQTAYLKAYFPVEFMTALFNAESGDVERISVLVSEAKKMDISVLPPDINASSTLFAPEGTSVRFGLLAIKNVGANIVEAIIEERRRGGPFADLGDFLSRVQHKDLNKKSLESLAKSGALESLGAERNAVLKNIDDILKFVSDGKKARASSQNSLFAGSLSALVFRLKAAPPASTQEKLGWEKELLGLYISDHPLNAHLNKLAENKVQSIKEIAAKGAEIPARAVISIAGIVSRIKRITTKLGQPMIFAGIEDLSGTMEIIVFSDTLAKNPDVWQENSVLMIKGGVSLRDGETKIICREATAIGG